jgi:dienelactone hydrolase
VKFLNANNGTRKVPAKLDYVQIDLFGRGNNAYRWAGETDVLEAIEHFFASEQAAGRGKHFDPRRVVLRGFSMGGAGTWHLGLHSPSRWCVIGPGAGFTTTHGYVKFAQPLPSYQEACLKIYDAVEYAENAANVPIVAYSGEKDAQKAAADNVEAKLKALGLPMTHLIAPDLAHSFPAVWFDKANQHYAKHVAAGRPDYPEKVSFVTYTTKYPGSAWVEILGVDKHYVKTSVQATRVKNGFQVATKNVRALHLTLPENAVGTQDVRIDEQLIPAKPSKATDQAGEIYLQKTNGVWKNVLPQLLVTHKNQKPQKSHGLQGPIDDAFTEAFLCVRGTGRPWHSATQKFADARLAQFKADWSKHFRGTLPIKNDFEVTSEDIAEKHLILFGDPSSNALIAQVVDDLPLSWNKEAITIAGKKVAAGEHVPMLIHPNPLNATRYVVLNTGHTFPSKDYTGTNALLFPRLGDYAVLNIDASNADPVVAGLFNEYWQIEK